MKKVDNTINTIGTQEHNRNTPQFIVIQVVAIQETLKLF
jgi:hypothetical protein